MSTHTFQYRHIGPTPSQQQTMLESLGYKTLNNLLEDTIPEQIYTPKNPDIPNAVTEHKVIEQLAERSQKNQLMKNFIGCGYYGTHTPAVIRRAILENPGWYTQYTPYQPEISQGRLEALMNFQTTITEMTGLPIANASLLDESTAVAEAVFLAIRSKRKPLRKCYLSHNLHPQNIAVTTGRCEGADVQYDIGDATACVPENYDCLVIQYPNTYGEIEDIESLIGKTQDAGCLVILATDLLALTILKSPGELGADIAVGSSQRFGVPLGFGGPHAAFFATKDEYKRLVPGRIVGLSKDKHGNPARRLALQTREQHIRREKATSNICTAQALLANIAGTYALWHGPTGLSEIAQKVNSLTGLLHSALTQNGHACKNKFFFDTLSIHTPHPNRIKQRAEAHNINLRYTDHLTIISLDETAELEDIAKICDVFEVQYNASATPDIGLDKKHHRETDYMSQQVFHTHHSETSMMRYLKSLENKDISLTHSMIPLGSCTMKLNPATALTPITWPHFCNIHPFAPDNQTSGWLQLITELEDDLAKLTGFDAVSIQPNSGAQGEYAGLLMIKAWHKEKNQKHRNICLIPRSAHGTNPASAMMAGFQVVAVNCLDNGNVDLSHLRAMCEKHSQDLAALMITYPSTHGVFEESIRDICDIIHEFGGQVYLDGANMNAQIGLCFAGQYGADVCHLNLHKTFSIPHGGGGPGVGPIAIKAHLKPFLPKLDPNEQSKGITQLTSAPYGSAGVLPISWTYIRMMGGDGLQMASKIAILNANYIAKKLSHAYPILYTGQTKCVAHECIIDIRPFQKTTGIQAVDIAKRLMDFGFHAPTMSFPVAGTLMIEPTESENLEELDRFCEAMLIIYDEIKNIEKQIYSKDDNPLVNAPHTYEDLSQTEWPHSYSREKAFFPLHWVKDKKFWPMSGRIDEAYGDRNLICSCDDSILKS